MSHPVSGTGFRAFHRSKTMTVAIRYLNLVVVRLVARGAPAVPMLNSRVGMAMHGR